MKRLLAGAGLAVAGLAALAALAVGTAGGNAARATTIHVVEHATTDVVTDTGKKGDTAGDLLTFANALFDAADKAKVGTDQGFCVRTVVGKAWECWWTATLAKGQLTVEGPFLDSGPSTLAITGGTGAYADARGSMTLKAHGSTAYDFVYRISG